MEKEYEAIPQEEPSKEFSEWKSLPEEITDEMIKSAEADLKEAQEDEENILARLRRRGKTSWLLASSVVLLTSLASMWEHVSHSSQDRAKAYAASFIGDRKHEESRVSGIGRSASEMSAHAAVEGKDSDVIAKMRKEWMKDARVDPPNVIVNVEDVMKLTFGMSVLVEAAKHDPSLFSTNWENITQFVPDITPVIETTLLTLPTSLLDSYQSPLVKKVLESSKDPVVVKIHEINSLNVSDKEKGRLLSLLDSLMSNLSLEEAQKLVGDDDRFMKALMKIASTPDHVASASVREKLDELLVPIISEMNELHEAKDDKRFAALKQMDARKLYLLLVVSAEQGSPGVLLSESVAYPSTYQGIFDHFLSRLHKDKTSGYDLLRQMGDYQADEFISLAAQRGRFGDFLETMTPQEQQKFLQDYFESLSEADEVSVVAGVAADVLRQTKNPQTLAAVSKTIRIGFEKAGGAHPDVRAAYGVLSVLAEDEPSWISQSEREQFRLTDLSSIETRDLESDDGRIYERYFFYNDEDGRASFGNFIKDFSNRPGWTINRKKGYVIVTSKGQDREIAIFANEPSTGPGKDQSNDFEEKGINDPVDTALEKAGITPTVFVHRGHIYHQNFSTKRLPESAKLLVLGSCGGYATVDQIAKDHPDVQVISTKGTGTKMVNDAVLRLLEIQLRDRNSVNWKEFWRTASKKLGENADFRNYVPPQEHWNAIVSGRVRHFAEAYKVRGAEQQRLAANL